jgi:hypothetical protein
MFTSRFITHVLFIIYYVTYIYCGPYNSKGFAELIFLAYAQERGNILRARGYPIEDLEIFKSFFDKLKNRGYGDTNTVTKYGDINGFIDFDKTGYKKISIPYEINNGELIRTTTKVDYTPNNNLEQLFKFTDKPGRADNTLTSYINEKRFFELDFSNPLYSGKGYDYFDVLKKLDKQGILLEDDAVEAWYKAAKSTRVNEMNKVLESVNIVAKISEGDLIYEDLDPGTKNKLAYQGFSERSSPNKFIKNKKRYFNNHVSPINLLENILHGNIFGEKDIPDSVKHTFNDLPDNIKEKFTPTCRT